MIWIYYKKVQELDHATPHWSATQAKSIQPPASHQPNKPSLVKPPVPHQLNNLFTMIQSLTYSIYKGKSKQFSPVRPKFL